MAVDAHAEWAAELAKQLIRTGKPPPNDIDDAQRLALAWALKDCAIAAWSTDPPAVSRAGEGLGGLLAAKRNEVLAKAETEIRAIYQWVAGIAALTRGAMTEAISHLDEASTTFRSIEQPGHAAHSQVPKVMALSILGRHTEAADSGLTTERELLAVGDYRSAAKVNLNLGNMHYRCNHFESANANYARAAELVTRVADDDLWVATTIGMADSHAAMGDFDDALDAYRRAERRALDKGLSVPRAVVMESVSLIQLARGQHREALLGLEAARRQYEELAIPQNVALAEKQLADAYLEVRLLPEALALYDHALRRFEALEMPVERAWALTQRGRTLAALMRSAEDVADCLGQASPLFLAQGVSAGQATVLHARAELALVQGDAEAAIRLATNAADLFAASALLPAQAQSNVVRAYALLMDRQVDAASELFAATLKTGNELQLLSLAVRCQVGIGLVAKAHGDTTAAKREFESAIASSEEQRAALPGDDIRSAFLMDQLRPYEELLRIALDADDAAPTINSTAAVLQQLERFRARALGERLGEPTRAAASSADHLDSEQRAHLSWLYRRRQKLIDEGDDATALTEETRRVEHELLEQARRRRLTASAELLPADVRAFDPALLQSALGEGEAVVEYGVVDDELFACVITRDQVALKRRLASWSEVMAAINAARFQIDSLRHGTTAVDRHLELLTRRSIASMRRTYDLLWAPFSASLAGCRRVLVVPHDQLGAVQFAALHDGQSYLAQTLEIAMAPSANIALQGFVRKPVPPARAVALGESSRLRHAADEADFVAALFDEAIVLTGQAADAGSLRVASTNADVLHLACHAEFRSDNPMFSALQLVDGPFTAQDAETLSLRHGIVVLSACETGVATYSRGDEMIGLVRAFLVAGASRVVASLWPVDDAVTMRFMAAFYRSLRAGHTASASLRAAQLDVMQTHPHPFYWAAFRVYGGW